MHKATQELCARLNLEFTFPTRRRQNDNFLSAPFEDHEPHSLLDLPDGLLVAAMVVVVKYMYPVDKIERMPQDPDDPLTLRMDWAAWGETFVQRGQTGLGRLDFEKLDRFENLDPQKIWTMSQDDIDEYLTWYEKARVDKTRPSTYFTYPSIISCFLLDFIASLLLTKIVRNRIRGDRYRADAVPA